MPGKGVLQGHHIVEKVMIEEHLATRFGFTSLSEGESPVKILTATEHQGAGNTSLHNKMWFQWNATDGKGILHHDRLGEFTTAQDMMNELIDFYNANGYGDLAKATRGWCIKNGVPFTH